MGKVKVSEMVEVSSLSTDDYLMVIQGQQNKKSKISKLTDLYSGPLTLTKTLTSAQILALNTTPVLLVDAPGSGKYISLIQVDYLYTFGGVAYTRNASASMVLSYDAVTASGIALVGALLTQSSDAVTLSANGSSFASIAQSLLLNKGVYLVLNAGSFTAGNGTLKLKILYQIITV